MDYVAGRYGEPYQSAYRCNQVLQLPLRVAQGEGEWDTLGLPQALREYPPTVTAAGWMAQVWLAAISLDQPPLLLFHFFMSLTESTAWAKSTFW